MQLLYGNDGVNYRTLDKSSDMPNEIQNSILSTYAKYDFVSNSQEYSSAEKEPEILTYVTSNFDNQAASEMLFVCKTAHMRQYLSPSFYLHGVAKEVSDDFYKRDFFQIFNYEFVKDIDVAKYQKGSIEAYPFNTEPMDRVFLTEEQLIVILANFMANDQKGQKTKIFVDATGDAYNFRSREILASIYHYLPYELRKRYGFKSYSKEEKKFPARVAFVLFNKRETVGDGTFITLEETVSDIRSVIDAQYIDYAEYLVRGMNEEQREDHFEEVSKLAKNGRLTIKDCLTYFSSTKKWSSGTQEEFLPEWIDYVDKNSFRKGPLYEKLLKIIIEKVDNQYYNDYLFNRVLGLYREKIYNLSSNAAKVIRFADCLEEIYIKPERFSKWYREELERQEKQLDSTDPLYSVKLQELYQQEISRLEGIDIRAEELTILLQTEINCLVQKAEELENKVTEVRTGESKAIWAEFDEIDGAAITVFISKVIYWQNHVKFEENREHLNHTIGTWVETHFKRNFKNLMEVETYRDALKQLESHIEKDQYRSYDKILFEEEKRLKAEQEALNCILRKEDLLENYKKLIINLENQILEPQNKIQITFGTHGNTKSIQAADFQKILEFILCPSEDNQSILSIWKGFLLGTDVLKAEHLPYLLSSTGNTEELKTILNYFFKSPVKISMNYAAKVFFEKHSDKAQTFIKCYETEKGERVVFAKALGRICEKEEEENSEEEMKSDKMSGFKNTFSNFLGRKK